MTKSVESGDIYDVIIIGGGPGGLTAGLYCGRSRMKTLLLEGSSTVSQITVTDIIENYPGIPDIGGFELIDRMKGQAVSFGVEIKSEQVLSVTPARGGGPPRWAVTGESETWEAWSVIVATGAVWRNLGVPGEKTFTGRGVSYCATCDGPFFRNRAVAVVGGGDAAVQEALFLTRFAREVTLIHRRDRLRAAEILQERSLANEKSVSPGIPWWRRSSGRKPCHPFVSGMSTIPIARPLFPWTASLFSSALCPIRISCGRLSSATGMAILSWTKP